MSAAPSCECDYDAEGDPLEYVKCSHYCPLHDMCESCGDCLGIAKDPTFPVGYDPRIRRAAWLCAECLKDDEFNAEFSPSEAQAVKEAIEREDENGK